jgi:hypothetical protein
VSFILRRFLSGQEKPIITPIFRNISKREAIDPYRHLYLEKYLKGIDDGPMRVI